MEYRRKEIGAGIFLLASFVVLTVMIFAVSDIQSLFKQKSEYKARFSYSDGIEKNAQVRFSGIKVGKVTNIRVATGHGDQVELTLSVYRDTVIKKDTHAAIKTLGLVGGKYVELSGGSAKSEQLMPGDTLIGDESFKLEDLTKAGLDVVDKMKGVADNMNRLLGDPETAKSIKIVVRNLQEASENLKVMTSSKEEIAQGLKNLPEIMKKLDDTTTNLRALTEKSDKLVVENKKKIDETLDNIQQTTQNLKDATEEVKKAPWKLLRKP